MKRLLIIEDDKLVSRIYAAKFSTEGYTVEIAGDGESGLAALETFQPGVILLDLMLPGISGVEVLKQVRASGEFAALPVVVFSNIYMDGMAEEVASAGATCCLPKATTSPRQVIEAVNAAVSVASEVEPAAAATADGPEYPVDVRESFLASLPEVIAGMQPLEKIIATADSKSIRVPALQGLYEIVHALAGSASMAGVPLLARMASAFEALLKELCEHQNQITVSTVRTVSQTVAFLAQMSERAESLSTDPVLSARIMAVDDDPISLRAVLTALGKAELQAHSHQNPTAAWEQMRDERFDLVILDIDMPRMTGFDLCRRLRQTAAYAQTPVIFVTSLHDFNSRAKGAVSGADDLIAKPFLFIELGLKALTHVVKPHVLRARA